MRADRLLELADFLENHVSPARFNMGEWFTYGGPHYCGSAGCALGWATVLFEDQGLLRCDHNHCPTLSIGAGESELPLLAFKAATHFFDVSYDMARCLFGFDANLNNDVSAVVRRILDCVRLHQEEELSIAS